MTETQTANGNRAVLLLIAGIPLTMVLAATWLWYFVVEGDLDLVGALGTANKGTLLSPPRQIADFELRNEDGAPWAADAEASHWIFVVPVRGDCDAGCENLLYTTRQIHQAMGKEMARLRRLLVTDRPLTQVAPSFPATQDGSPLPASMAEYIERGHRGIGEAYLPSPGFERLFADAGSNDTWFLMDPAGWVMMAYPPEVHYKDVISDLKFLLKNSNG